MTLIILRNNYHDQMIREYYTTMQTLCWGSKVKHLRRVVAWPAFG
jgi:hypothetical protein